MNLPATSNIVISIFVKSVKEFPLKKLFFLFALLTLCLIVGGAYLSAQDFDKVQIKTTKVAGNIYMLEGAGGNIGVSAGALQISLSAARILSASGAN